MSREEAFAANSGNRVSLCISRVFPNIGWRRIKRHMIDAQLGFIERVDVIPVYDKNTGKIRFKRAFVHFRENSWNTRDPQAREALERLRSGESIRLVYEDPWWWSVSISTAERPDEAPKPPMRKTRIVASDDNSAAAYDASAQPDDEMRGAAALAATGEETSDTEDGEIPPPGTLTRSAN
tara:strand:+ start:277 stop:816 length:540 start_codon:yes stop_codon:yes gene_type:complete